MNNDRFKFRVWCEKDQEYIEDQCDECFVGFDGNVVCGAYYDDDFYGHMDYYQPSEIVVEQCTGLKDKNGNLIYEGDIVLYEGQKYIVKWFDGCFVLAPMNSPCDMPGYRPFTELSVVPKLLEEKWQIIGNVHTEEQK